MGSILSFPILCLANLGTYLVTMRPVHSSEVWSTKEILSHVLVNGDDMVYAGPRALWERQIKIAGDIGLKMSIGKAYHHRTYLNINSTSVHYGLHLDRDREVPYEIPYFNTGLFYGVHKVQRKECADDHCNLDKGVFINANTVLRGSLPGKEKDVLSQYISLHKNEMKEKCKILLQIPDGKKYKSVSVHRNWFLPLSSGGMGIAPPLGWKFRIKKRDKMIAYNLAKTYSCPCTTQLPTPGYILEKHEEIVTVPWAEKKELDDEVLEYTGTYNSLKISILSGCKKKRCVLPVIYYSTQRTSMIH